MSIDRPLEEESARTLVGWYPDGQNDARAGSQISLDGSKTHTPDIGKSHPVERSLIACPGDHCRLADINGSRFTTIQMPDNAHGSGGHIKDGSRSGGWLRGLCSDVGGLCRRGRYWS